MKIGTVAAVLSLVVLPSAAWATGDAAAGLEALRETNLIVLGNMVGGQEVEGKTFVGGDLSGNATNFGIGNTKQGAAVSTSPTLTVGGNVTSNGINLNNGSNGGTGLAATSPGITVGGSLASASLNAKNAAVIVGGNLSNINGSTGSSIAYGGLLGGYHNSNGATFAQDTSLASGGSNSVAASIAAQTTTLTANLTALSAQLGGFAADSTIDTTDANNFKFVSTGGSDHVAVFSITDAATFFTTARAFSFDLTGATSVIINVSNATAMSMLTINQNFLGIGDYAQTLIWNISPDIAGITLQTGFVGSLLAIKSDLKNSNYIQGAVAVANFVQNGEVHLGTYDGSDFGGTGSVPEPSTWLQMIAGFSLIGLARRRRSYGQLHIVAA